MALDQFKMLAQVTLAAGGIDASSTTLNFASGQGAKLPSTGPFNLVVWDWTVAGDNPANDPNAESIRVPSGYAGGDSATGCTRAQEGTTAKAHNTAGHTFKAVLHLGTKFIDDLIRKDSAGHFIADPKLGVGTLTTVGDVFEVERSLSGADVVASVRNVSDTASSRAIVKALVGGTSAGDPFLWLKIPNGNEWHVGVDNSDADKLKIGTGSVVGAAGVTTLTLRTDAPWVGIGTEVPDRELDVERTLAGGSVSIGVVNLDNTIGSSEAFLLIDVGGASAGDPYVLWSISAVQSFSAGIDNSDSDSFKITEQAGLQASTRVKILSGYVTIATPSSAPTDSNLFNGSVTWRLDQTGHNLIGRVKYSDGTLKTATIALT